MQFSEWLVLEEEDSTGVRVYKKENPKYDSSKSFSEKEFVVLYGATYPIKNELKKLGLKYFKGTWSIGVSKFENIKQSLVDLGVDLSGLEKTMTSPPSSSSVVKNKSSQETEDFFQDVQDSLEGELKKGTDAKLKKLVDNIENLIEKVANSTDEAGKQRFIKDFLKFSSKFHNYSLANQILIYVQSKGQAAHVSSPTNWTKLGRTVTNWDKGIVIFAPNFKNIEKENPSTGEKEKVQLKFFRAVKVYDYSATDPIPGNPSSFKPLDRKDWSSDTNEDVEELNVLINSLVKWNKEKSINVDYEDMAEDLGGYSAGGKIAINNKFKGVNLFSTLVHETAHEILHWLEKKSKKSDLGKQSSRQQKEIDAETTAYVVCHHFGFETKDAPNYLALWRAKGDDVKARRQNIAKASKMIIHGIEDKVTETEIEFEDMEENTQLKLQFDPKPSIPKVVLSGWIKDGRILANIDGEDKTFVTDAIHHNRFKKMKPELAYKHILKLISNGRAFELEKRR